MQRGKLEAPPWLSCAVQEERTGAEEESRKARELRLAAAMKDKHTREEQIQYVLWLTVIDKG